jgi:hypothetical protein
MEDDYVKKDTKKDRDTKRKIIYNANNTNIRIESVQLTNVSKNKYLLQKSIIDEKLNLKLFLSQ